MKKGLRFQTKLMLTLVAAIAAVTFALIMITESKVTQAYTKQFSRDFNHIVAQLERSRLERSVEFIELCNRLAAHPYIVASLSGEPTKEQNLAFWRFYIDSLYALGETREGRPEEIAKRTAPSAEILGRIGSVGIVTKSGGITSLFHPLANTNPKDSEKRRLSEKRLRNGAGGVNQAKKRIDDLLGSDRQQTLYLPFDSHDGSGYVQEVVSTPVKKPGTNEIIGHFLRATAAETEAQRFLERYQQEFESSAPLLSGIFLDGQLYSRNLDEKLAELMAAVITEKLPSAKGATSKKPSQFDATIGGAPYRLYVAPLAGGDAFDPAYQVSAFSLATLKHDLSELRVRGSGIGFFALLLGLGLAYLFSRNLAIPIRELTRATNAVKSGDLDTRIKIRSLDEIGELAVSFNDMAEGLQQRDVYRDILGKVSDETVAQAMISGALDLELGGELKTVSVLFCDIRGFTSITEHMPPTEVIEILNQHMTAMMAVVRNHFGVVDKFVGDEIMAVFGALKSYGNDAEHAAACALEMITVRERLNREIGRPLEIGIGVATGEVVAGCMGSVDRLNYTVLGARVNLASRLCGEAGNMEAVIDDNTLERLDPLTAGFKSITDLRLKGFSEIITAYHLHDLAKSGGEKEEAVVAVNHS